MARKKNVVPATTEKVTQSVHIKGIEALSGVKDVLPTQEGYWQMVYHTIDNLVKTYSFSMVTPPVVENQILYKKIYADTRNFSVEDIAVVNGAGREVAVLRPDITPSVVRALGNHSLLNIDAPAKVAYVGPIFRSDAFAGKRLKQSTSFGMEIIGVSDQVAVAQLILLGYKFFKNLGLDVVVHINDIGCSDCRPELRRVLGNYYKNNRNRLCDECRKHLAKSPWQVMACSEKKCAELQEDAPPMVDWLCEKCKDDLTKTLEYLDELQVPYFLNPTLVRSVGYYSGVVFEFQSVGQEQDAKLQNSWGGGGRYDNLFERLGGVDFPGAGMVIPLEKVVNKIQEVKGDALVVNTTRPRIFLAQIGHLAKRKAMVLFERLTAKGIAVAESFILKSLRAQLQESERLGVELVLIIGQKEALDNTVVIRDTSGGIQEAVMFNAVESILEKRLPAPVSTNHWTK